jgi:hypothetical protein
VLSSTNGRLVPEGPERITSKRTYYAAIDALRTSEQGVQPALPTHCGQSQAAENRPLGGLTKLLPGAAYPRCHGRQAARCTERCSGVFPGA